MSLILAIDQSTSATKAVLFDARGKVLDKASKAHRQIYPRPGWVEHDAMEIWRSQLTVARKVLKNSGTHASDVGAIGVANQRDPAVGESHGFGLTGT